MLSLPPPIASVIVALFAGVVLSGTTHAQSATVVSSTAAWIASTRNDSVVATFSEPLWAIGSPLAGDWTLNGVTYRGRAGTPYPNIFVANTSPLTDRALTANGDEDIDLILNPPREAIGFDTAVNPFGPVTVTVFDAAGGQAGSTMVPAGAVGFVGWVSHGSIGRINFRSVNGAVVDSFLDNVRLADSSCSTCRADVNCSGSLSVQDIFDFLAAYFAGNPRADYNDSGAISVQDIFDFLAAYFAGCQ